MPYFSTSQEWLEKSALLLKARPSTTRIVTKYSVKPRHKSKSTKLNAVTATDEEPIPGSETASTVTHKATLTVRTFDPASGVCLKYETSESKEVGRLMASLGRLGRTMAALPDAPIVDDSKMADSNNAGVSAAENPTAEQIPHGPKNASNIPAAGGGGSNKKKKKGKK